MTCLQFVGEIDELAEPLIVNKERVIRAWGELSAQLQLVHIGHKRLEK